MEEKEIWQEIEYPKYMQKNDETKTCFVSNFGRVKTPKRIVKARGNSVRIQQPMLLSLSPSINGYLRCSAGLVHRLVGRAFVEKPKEWVNSASWTINHKDLDKTNNHWTNLEWVPHRVNCQHYYDSDLAIGKRNIPVEAWNYETDEFVGVYPSQSHMAKELGLHRSAINMILKGKNKSTGGYGLKQITPEEYYAKKSK